MKENRIKIIITLIIVLTGLIVLIVYKAHVNKSQTANFISEKYQKKEIYEINEFYTVLNCLNDYYYNHNDQDYVRNVLSANYIFKNSNNNDNNFIAESGLYSYSLDKLYLYQNSYYKIYYAVGAYNLEDMDSIIESTKVLNIVIFDIGNNTYSIIPIGSGTANFDYYLKYYNLLKYNLPIKENINNKIVYQEVSDEVYALIYFEKFKKLVLSDCQNLYKIVDDNMIKKYPSYKKFSNFCKIYNNKYINSEINKYKISSLGNANYIEITDNYDNVYNIDIESVNDYRLNIYIKN